jgi:CheY-like chemotaxis protein/two-component sensor histidine kinase
LNNPLSVVVGQTLLMKETATDEKIQRRAELIGNAADRCGRIVKTFLAMARQKPPDSQSVDLNEIVSDTLEVLKYTLGQSAIYVEDSLAENLPMVWGDPDQLGQIILNLVVNAQHALETVEGERRIGITTTDEFDTNTVVLRILDNGPGIPRALQNRIFEPFFTTKEVGLGTGLGLALTRKIVEAHGGSIDLGDTVTGGCSFVVRLPRWEHAAEAKAPDVPSTRPAARSILIVDDEEDVIMTLQDILEFDGHAVVTASSGGAAMKALDEQRFDAVLTDLRMQETDGISLFRHIADAHPGIVSRVAFVTGDTLSPDVRDFLAEAERPILEKPFRPDDVRALISELTNS